MLTGLVNTFGLYSSLPYGAVGQGEESSPLPLLPVASERGGP